MRRVATSALLLLAFATTAARAEATFDRLVDEYAPYVDVAAPLGFGLKIDAISADPYKFWRGTKGLFFDWCKSNAADWLAEPAATRVPSHGDVHLGNVGTYADGWGHAAFGLVDFDDAIALPFQLDLLEACITTRLIARVQHVDADQAAIDRATFDAYRAALTSGQTATALLADDSTVKRLIAKAARTTYADDLAKFCTGDGAFRRVIYKRDKPTDVLTPVAPTDAMAAAIAQACASDPALAARMRVTDAVGLRGMIRGACVRTRLGSSGSQGLSKILVRLDRPFRDVDGDVILYLKQQIPTAAERAGVATRGDVSPGERAKRMIDALARPRPIVNGFATFESRSYAVSLKDPWADDLDPATVDSADELTHVARVMATALGAAHGADGRGTAIAARLTPEAMSLIRERADRYVAEQQTWHESLASDARAIALARQAERTIAEATR